MLNQSLKTHKIAFLLSLFLPALSHAQVFEATGTGATAEQAKQDAVTNAIKFSVGEYIVNKEELTNDDFSQKVVGYSNAYVKKIAVKSQNQLTNGDYEATVAVDIESQKLIEQLKEMQVAVAADVVNDDLLSDIQNQVDKIEKNKQTAQNFEDLVEELLVTPIKENKAILHIDIAGKLRLVENNQKNAKSDQVELELPVNIYPDENYVKAVKRILKEAKDPNDSRYRIWNENFLNKENGFIKEKYKISFDKHNVIFKKVVNIWRETYNYIKLELIDKDLESMATFYGGDEYNNHGLIPIVKVLDSKSKNSYYILWMYNIKFKPEYFPTNSEQKLKAYLRFKLKTEQIKALKDIKVSFADSRD
ncbi:hypothetical protein [Lonepinella sp. BR2271]|uniref:hypothetical protein n=1 Tax=Lonepinella sp. BR2271 TaxID=3434550 RepID=UPI003F6E0D2E